MIFIELKAGLSIKKSEVVAVEEIGDNKIRIYLKNNKIEVNYPYQTLLQVLEMESSKNEKVESKVEAFLDTQGHFAG